MNKFRVKLPIILKEHRLKANITQLELSNRLNTSLRSYQRFESGEAEPSIGQLYAISEILKLRITELFNHSEHNCCHEGHAEKTKAFERAIKVAKVGFFEYRIDSNDFVCSDSFNYVTGKTCNSRLTLERFVAMVDDFETRIKFLESIKSSFVTGAPINLKTRILYDGHDVRHVEFQIEPHIEEGKIIGLIGTVTDISKYRELEIHLLKVLNEKEEINQLAGVGHWEYNIKDDILIWSDSAYGVFGVDRRKPINRISDFFERVHPEDLDLIMSSYKNSLVTKKPYEVEHRIVTPSGQLKWVHQKCITYLDQFGEPVRSNGFTIDVTRWKCGKAI